MRSHLAPLRLAPALLAIAGAAGCASTSITSLVSPSAPRYGTAQILVVAAYADLKWRSDVELGLQARHPAFRASVHVLDVNGVNDAGAIVDRVMSDSLLEAVLLIGPKGAGLSTSFMASQYYVGTVSKPWANTAATLYDVIDAKTVWQADASTSGGAYTTWSEIRGSFIGKIVAQLQSDGLLVNARRPPRPKRRVHVAASDTGVRWARPLPGSDEIILLTRSDFNEQSQAGSLFDRVAPALVRIEGNRGLGTAFLITRDGLAITNHHVIAGQSRLAARFSDGTVSPVRVMRSDEAADVALVEVQCKGSCSTVPLGAPASVAAGSEVFAIGHPAGLTASLTRGIVSALRRARGVTLIQVDAALNAGNSGGPILDTQGRAIGVVSFKVSETEGLGFGVAVEDALRVLGVLIR